jgi:integrase/recombinase XerD
MTSKYERPEYQKAIFRTIDHYIIRITLEGEVVIGKTRTELAKELEISPATLKKYLDVYTKLKGMPYKFIDTAIKDRKPDLAILSEPPISENIINNNILDVLSKYTTLYIDSKLAVNLSEKTIYNSKIILERFYSYVAEEFSDNQILAITDVNKYFINNYLNQLTEDGLSKNTQKLHLTVLKGYFSFIADSELEQFGFLKINLDNIRIKTEQKEKDSLGQAEQTKLLNYVAGLDAKKSYLAQRNALLIKVLLYTGVRISELINIKWTDIAEHYDVKHGYIYVILLHGKGNKERYTYLLHEEVKGNLEFLRLNSATSPYLFVSTHGNQCNRSSLFDVVKNLLHLPAHICPEPG